MIKVDVLKDLICQNHENLSKWNHLKNKKYEAMREDLLAEKIVWEKDQEKIQKASKKDSEVIHLNIGGTVMLMTSIDVLTSDKGSNLEKMFSGKHEHKMIDDKVFLDRDGETFKTLINYLRNE
jgi:long-subunit acyl-CoA synthetase (AMP-forming)